MSTAPAVPSGAQRPASGNPARALRVFHVGTALLLLSLVLWGFHHFYFSGQAYPGRPLTPPIRTLVIAHGVTMGAWIILLTIQTTLIAGRRHALHMKLGWLGAALAAVIVVVGWNLGVSAARVNPDPAPPMPHLTQREFLIVPIGTIVLFALGVGGAIAMRKRPAAHRALLLLGTFGALAAAVSRIDALSRPLDGTAIDRAFGPYSVTILIAGALVLVRRALTKTWDPWFTWGWVVLVGLCYANIQLAQSGPWRAFADWLVG